MKIGAFPSMLLGLKLWFSVASAEECIDMYEGNCEQELPMEKCNSSDFIRIVCQKTCGLCGIQLLKPSSRPSVAPSLSPVPTTAPTLAPSDSSTPHGTIQHSGDSSNNCWYVQDNEKIGLKTCDRTDPSQVFWYGPAAQTKQIRNSGKCVEASGRGQIGMVPCTNVNSKRWEFNGPTSNSHMHTGESICSRASGSIVDSIGCIGSSTGVNPELEFLFLEITPAPTKAPTNAPTESSDVPSVAPSICMDEYMGDCLKDLSGCDDPFVQMVCAYSCGLCQGPTIAPTLMPITPAPTKAPTNAPTWSSEVPSIAPTLAPSDSSTPHGIIQHSGDSSNNCWYVQDNEKIGLKTCDRTDPSQVFWYGPAAQTKQIRHSGKCVEASGRGQIGMVPCTNVNSKKWEFNGPTSNSHMHTGDSICSRASGSIVDSIGCIGSSTGVNPELEFLFLEITPAPTKAPTNAPTWSTAPTNAPSPMPSIAIPPGWEPLDFSKIPNNKSFFRLRAREGGLCLGNGGPRLGNVLGLEECNDHNIWQEFTYDHEKHLLHSKMFDWWQCLRESPYEDAGHAGKMWMYDCFDDETRAAGKWSLQAGSPAGGSTLTKEDNGKCVVYGQVEHGWQLAAAVNCTNVKPLTFLMTKQQTKPPQTAFPTSAPTWEIIEMGDTGAVPTAAPTNVAAPKLTVNKASSHGDPHFETFGKATKYDFHGQCDLVLLQNEGFTKDLGLHIHIRTKIETWWSFIEAAVVAIGSDTIEIRGGANGADYWINDKQGTPLKTGDQLALAGYVITFKKVSSKHSKFRLDLGHNGAISLETFKDWVAVNIQVKDSKSFNGATGLMGSFPTGAMMSRNNSVVISDPNDFGKEWQVLDTETMFFHELGSVHHPQKCIMPSSEASATKKRRLGEASITTEAAEMACAHAERFEACVFDVLAVGDLDFAGAY